MGDYGFRISKDGIDVKTGDDKDMVITSKYPVLKGSISGGGTASSVPSRTIYVEFTAATDDIITSSGHGLNNGDKILVSTDDTLPGGLSANTPYFVIDKTTNTFKVSLTSGGSAVNITSTGVGPHYWEDYYYTVTVAHNLGYIPFSMCFAYSEDYGFWWQVPIGFDGSMGHLYLQSYCDDTNFYFLIDWVYDGDPTIDVTYKYFIYLDKANL